MSDPIRLDGRDGPEDEDKFDDNWDIDDEDEEAEFEEEEDTWVDWEDDDAFYREEEAPYVDEGDGSEDEAPDDFDGE